MDARGRLGTAARNWDFSSHHPAAPILKHGPPTNSFVTHPHNETSLKMSSSYNSSSNRDTQIPPPPPNLMDLHWAPQQNYLSNHHHSAKNNATNAIPVNRNPIIDMHAIPVCEEETRQDQKKGANKKKAATNRVASKSLRPKEPKKKPNNNNNNGNVSNNNNKKKKEGQVSPGVKYKKSRDEECDDLSLDLSTLPAPICSCTGVARQCYRWGSGGWQSSCCTTTVSEYPLPMSESRPGARMAGRKMSVGAYRKLVQRLALEGHQLSYPLDLKDHWSRHGTNKFVTIK